MGDKTWTTPTWSSAQNITNQFCRLVDTSFLGHRSESYLQSQKLWNSCSLTDKRWKIDTLCYQWKFQNGNFMIFAWSLISVFTLQGGIFSFSVCEKRERKFEFLQVFLTILKTVSEKDLGTLEPMKNMVRISNKLSPSFYPFMQPENGIFSSSMVYSQEQKFTNPHLIHSMKMRSLWEGKTYL